MRPMSLDLVARLVVRAVMGSAQLLRHCSSFRNRLRLVRALSTL
jgi:hypothetical protein